MTKEQFLDKYSGNGVTMDTTLIWIWGNYAKQSRTMDANRSLLAEVCYRLNVKHYLQHSRSLSENSSFILYEKFEMNPKYHGQSWISTKYSLEEFIHDFIAFCEAEDKMKAEWLGESSIIPEELKKIGETVGDIRFSKIKTTKEAEEIGFINGFTNTKISLWWNTRGVRILFVRGKGVFELM